MILYFECFSGISGDMSVGSLLDLGADKQVLLDALNSLNIDGYRLEIGLKDKCGIFGTSFDVILEHQHTEHHHEHHSDEHNHQEHEEHSPECHHHEHRNIHDIERTIHESALTDNAKNLALKIFNFILRAEAKAHNKPEPEVHFHEVGAVDSIVDIVGVAVCIDNLGIKDVAVSAVYEGSGHVECAHGIMPVPVPAVVNIFQESGLELRITNNKTEMVTPTGAAILAALKNVDQLPEEFKIIQSGIGVGKKNFKHANILRTMLIEAPKKKSNIDKIWVLETNIDDSTGENLGFVLEQLFEAGVNDAYFTSIQMKKNRPAIKLSVICKRKKIEDVEEIIFRHLSTIGIRRYEVERTTLDRKIKKIKTSFGKCKFKIVNYKKEIYYYPEYEDVKRISLKQEISFNEVYYKLKNEIINLMSIS